ncbi:N-acetylglucosamine kinase-like BadF-type ATPase [Okibacterium sp. HSC-33S16]|uniref:N-acetylglucosamine kinase n=1 Tax=Okibacterium sp. HSC-33S16 TaxID=2910965 RepID=UPI00209CF6CA|nr:BadF/BadG/BcrA/BcrD ATPase family protein [Okibacterium sp. HSC-33S16]MCP2032456.1 N-acetylglucosamine kinase-like BadF-type ATPase [Okibacterium sp. HSC-33S16]
MTSSTTRLSIDGGQSGIRLRLTNASGILAEAERPGVLTDRPVVDQLADLTVQLATDTGTRIDELAVGTSGLTPAAANPGGLLRVTAAAGVRRVALAHDSITGYLAANGTEPGVMLAVGTGVVVLALSESSVAKVDGWGSLLGDAGSGYWIGRAGLDAALRAFDGRSTATTLQATAEARFGPLDELYMRVQADPLRVSVIASFCRDVVDAATAGDTIARGIVGAAAAELAHSAASALARVGWQPGTPARVGAVGALATHAVLMREQLTTELARQAPGAALAAPLGAPLDGVQSLLDVATSHPLRPYIFTAEAAAAA